MASAAARMVARRLFKSFHAAKIARCIVEHAFDFLVKMGFARVVITHVASPSLSGLLYASGKREYDTWAQKNSPTGLVKLFLL